VSQVVTSDKTSTDINILKNDRRQCLSTADMAQ
jgi:hypothetical protein